MRSKHVNFSDDLGIRILKFFPSILFFYDFPLISSAVTNLLFFPT
jgi:hypothetical protein